MQRALLLLATALCLSGCGTKSYEQQAGLSPLPTPIALKGAGTNPTQTNKMLGVMENEIRHFKTVEAAKAYRYQFQLREATVIAWTNASGIGPQAAKEAKEYQNTMTYYRRAFELKTAQLKAGDKDDSSGEVEKYLAFGRQCSENAQIYLVAKP